MIGKGMVQCDEHPNTPESWNNLTDLYEARGKPEEAEKRRAKLSVAFRCHLSDIRGQHPIKQSRRVHCVESRRGAVV